MVIGITANTPDGQDARFPQTRNADVLSIDSTCSKYRGAVEIKSCIGRLTKCWQIRFDPVNTCVKRSWSETCQYKSHTESWSAWWNPPLFCPLTKLQKSIPSASKSHEERGQPQSKQKCSTNEHFRVRCSMLMTAAWCSGGWTGRGEEPRLGEGSCFRIKVSKLRRNWEQQPGRCFILNRPGRLTAGRESQLGAAG